MTTTPSPAPKPWRKSKAPDYKPKHAPKPKEGAGKKVGEVLKATRDAAGRASEAVERVTIKDVTGKVSGAVSSAQTNHKRKIWAVVGLAAALGAAKLGTTGYEAVQGYRRTAAEERENMIPKSHIIVDAKIQVVDGKIKITPRGETKTDQCGQAHKVDVQPADAEQMRKGRMRASKGSVRFTVEAHDETHTYEADDDVVADGEEREITIRAHLVDDETEK